MTKQIIETGSSANDGTGDTLRAGAQKINANFTELYNSIYSLPAAGVGTSGTLGGVKVDGISIVISNGVISSTNISNPTASADNAITRFDGNTGRLLQNSLVTISDLGAIVAPIASSVIPFHYDNQAAFPSAGTYHGAIAHSHADGKLYFAHSGAWVALASASELPAAQSVTGIVKSSGTTRSAATSGTDYAPGTSTLATGIVKSTTTTGALSIAVAGTDYQVPITFTTTGTSGAATFNGTVLNIPQYTALAARNSTNGTTASLANDAIGNITITGWKSYMLLSIQTSVAAWVTVYTSSAARIADASRTITTDPTPGSGVIAEVITTGASTQIFSPAVFGFSDESSPSTDVQIKVVNRSGSTTAITITMKLVQLEI